MIVGARKRGIALIGVAAVAAMALALPLSAGASFDHRFSVISKDVRFHEIPNGFTGRTVLLNQGNRNNRVGYGHVRCRFIEPARKARCRVLFHLDGSIGGFGDLVAKGNIGSDDHTLQVVDGTGDFSGAVAGKAVIHHPGQPRNLIDFSLTR
jgi:hypothetical protein